MVAYESRLMKCEKYTLIMNRDSATVLTFKCVEKGFLKETSMSWSRGGDMYVY